MHAIRIGLVALLVIHVGGTGALRTAVAAEIDPADIDRAFDAMETYDWGADRGDLVALERAALACRDDAEMRADLESRLVTLLRGDISHAAKGVVCRQLSLIGTADAVPTLQTLLTDDQVSHLGRFALERMPCPEAAAAIRGAVAKTQGRLRVGMINSLGARRDQQSLPLLSKLMAGDDGVASAAATAAIGQIGGDDAAKVLTQALATVSDERKPSVADACLICAEGLLEQGRKVEAINVYRSLATAEVSKHVKLAATRGMLAATTKR